MTSKAILQFEKKLQNWWDQLTKQCLKERLDSLFIVGNLFSNPNPKNRAKDEVARKLKCLVESNIQVFILPGPRDTPLYLANDILPHYIFKSLPDVYIVAPAPDQSKKQPKIQKPLVETEITFTQNSLKGQKEIEIFATNSAFLKPQELEFDFKGNPKKISVMMLYGQFIADNVVSKLKNAPNIITSDILKKINNSNIDHLIVGGFNNYPSQDVLNCLNYNLIFSPPAIKCDFNFLHCDTGLYIQDLDGNENESKFLPFEGFEVTQKELSVTGKNPDDINASALQIIRDHSDPKNGYLQLRLDGIFPREKYQMLEIYELIDRGRKNNQYFELAEEIEFSEKGEDIGGLHPFRFIEAMIREQLESTDAKVEDHFLHQVLSKIKNDWDNLH